MNNKVSIIGKIARFVAAIVLLLLGILFGVFGALGGLLIVWKDIYSLPQVLVNLCFGGFLFYSFYTLLKKKKRFFLIIIYILLGFLLFTLFYRLTFVTHGRFESTDFFNILLFGIPAGLIFISKKLEQDTISGNNVSFNTATLQEGFRYAGVIERGIAVFIDQLVILVPILLIGLFLRNNSEQVNYLFFQVAGSIIYMIYTTIWEARDGQTLGKKIVKIKVLMDNGNNCTLRAAILRNIGRILDGFVGIFVILIITLTKKKQRLGDMLGNTIVVKV